MSRARLALVPIDAPTPSECAGGCGTLFWPDVWPIEGEDGRLWCERCEPDPLAVRLPTPLRPLRIIVEARKAARRLVAGCPESVVAIGRVCSPPWLLALPPNPSPPSYSLHGRHHVFGARADGGGMMYHSRPCCLADRRAVAVARLLVGAWGWVARVALRRWLTALRTIEASARC